MHKRIFTLGIVLCLLLTLSTAQANAATLNATVLLENHIRHLDSILPKAVEATQPEKPVVADLPVVQTVPITSSTDEQPIPTPTPVIQDAPVAVQEALQAPVTYQVADSSGYVSPDDARALGRQLALSIYGWGSDQFSCLDVLWTHESGWSSTISNPYSGAFGIAQSLPASKYVTGGFDYSASGQIKWGLQYIASGTDYRTPCHTLAIWNSRSPHWY